MDLPAIAWLAQTTGTEHADWSFSSVEANIVMTNILLVLTNVAVVAVTYLATSLELRRIRHEQVKQSSQLSAIRRMILSVRIWHGKRKYARRIQPKLIAEAGRNRITDFKVLPLDPKPLERQFKINSGHFDGER